MLRAISALAVAALCLTLQACHPAWDVHPDGSRSYPPAGWRLYDTNDSTVSPWNQRLDPAAKVAPYSPQAVTDLVAGTTGNGAPRPNKRGPTADDFGHPIFFGEASDAPEDQLFTVIGGDSDPSVKFCGVPANVNGLQVRMPVDALPAQSSDAHLSVLDDNNIEWDFWNVSVDEVNRTITVHAGRKVQAGCQGTHSSGTASRFPVAAGMVNPTDLAAGSIRHALFLVAPKTSIANKTADGTDCDAEVDPTCPVSFPAFETDGICPGCSLHMGDRLRLDPAIATDAWIDQHTTFAWERVMLRTLRDYGAYVGDATNQTWKLETFPARTSWTSFGDEDAFVGYARDHGLPQDVGGNYQYSFDDRIDWPSVLQVVDPCVAQTRQMTCNVYPRPGGATPLDVPLVPAFRQCTAPNTSHVSPVSAPSCNPQIPESSQLTTGTTGQGAGSIHLGVVRGDPSTPQNEADVIVRAKATDVRVAGTGADYTGRLILRSDLRITDRANGDAHTTAATLVDTPFSAPVGCVPTADTTIGSTCNLSTTANSILPGFAQEGRRELISARSLALLDAGPDQSVDPGWGACPPTCGSGDEKVYAATGIFAP